jgi:hypothetical protein
MVAVSEHDVFLVPSQFFTIQQAIDAVVRPATIMIDPGSYLEDIRIVGKEYLVIQSAHLSRRGVTLAGDCAVSVVAISESVVHLSGVEIRSNHRARGISAAESSISLQECVIAGNAVDERSDEPFGGGLSCRSSLVRIQKSTMAGNTAAGSSAGGGGIHLVDCKVEIAGSTIQTNAVYGSAIAQGGGIRSERSQMRMWRSRITDNALYGSACEGAGVYFSGPVGAQIGGSVITGNGSAHGKGGGVFIRGDPQRVVIHRNTVVRQNHPTDVYVDEAP